MSFWTGLATIFAFSQGRFNEKEPDIENIDPPLPAKYFTSRFRYFSSAFVFAGVYISLYVALIFIGSAPALQGTLRALFGSLSAGTPSTTNPQIGTPAWAAMMIMVIAPTTPRIRQLETWFRHWLQKFSNTPYKARELAEETIQAILPAGQRLDNASDSHLISVFNRLEKLMHELTASGGPETNHRYQSFFAENGEILTKTVDQFRAIEQELGTSIGTQNSIHMNKQQGLQSASSTERSQMAATIRRFARLIVCSLLYSEYEEYPARERLRKMAGFSTIRPANFRFSRNQVILGLFLIALSAMIVGSLGGIISFGITAPISGLTPAQLTHLLLFWATRSVMYSIAFILPLVLVAAVRLHLIDEGREHEMDWESYLVMLIVAFIGCFGLASLPIVAGFAYAAANNFGVTTLTIALLNATPPALAATAFLVISNLRWSRSTRLDAVFDFVIFAALGGAVAVFASSLMAIARLNASQSDFGLFGYFFLAEIPFMLTAAVVSGLNGTVQCAASRAIEARAHASD